MVRLQLEREVPGKQLSAPRKDRCTRRTPISGRTSRGGCFSRGKLLRVREGWVLQDYRGEKVVQHGGNIDGMSALVTMIPDDNFGMVILTNLNGSTLPSVLMYKTFDLHLKAPPKDWSADRRKVYEALVQQGKEAQKRLEAQRVSGTKPSLALADYAGVYADSMYGDSRVREEGGRLVLSRGPAFVGDLEHWNYDNLPRQLARARSPARASSVSVSRPRQAGGARDGHGRRVDRVKRRPEMADTTAGVVLPASDCGVLGTFSPRLPRCVHGRRDRGRLPSPSPASQRSQWSP